MKIHVIRYKETKDGSTIRTESFSWKEHNEKIVDISQKGFTLVEVFDDEI